MGGGAPAAWPLVGLLWLFCPACDAAHHQVGTVPYGFFEDDGNGAPGGMEGTGAGPAVETGGQVGAGGRIVMTDSGSCEWTPTRSRVDLFLLLDTYFTLPITGAAIRSIEGVKAYMRDPLTAGTGLGATTLRSTCDEANYANPDAPVGLLPAHATVVEDRLPDAPAIAVTSFEPALRSATTQARARAADNPAGRQAIVLLTQAIAVARAPCNLNDSLREAAAEAAAGTPPVPVYVVALGGDGTEVPLLPNEVLTDAAIAGGTQRAYPVNLLDDGAVAATLLEIRKLEQDCRFDLPPEVEVAEMQLTVNDESPIDRVADAAACDTVLYGYYVDDSTTPAQIIGCPSSCGRLRRLDAPTVITAPCP